MIGNVLPSLPGFGKPAPPERVHEFKNGSLTTVFNLNNSSSTWTFEDSSGMTWNAGYDIVNADTNQYNNPFQGSRVDPVSSSRKAMEMGALVQPE